MKATALLFCSFTLCALAQHPELKTGPNADLGGALLMPADDEWNRDVSKDEVDPLSEAIIASIGAETGLHEDFGVVWKGQPGGIPYYVVSGAPIAVQAKSVGEGSVEVTLPITDKPALITIQR